MFSRRHFFGTAAIALWPLLSPRLAVAEISPDDRDQVQAVFDRLVAAAAPVEGIAWPPRLDLVDSDQTQALATLDIKQKPAQSVVVVHRGILEKVIAGDENRLAMLLGHELAHLACGHVKAQHAGQTPLVEFAATRDEELEADLEGLKLALAAGYSYKECLSMYTQFIDQGLEYSSFEALRADHPSWKERLAHLDEQQAELWQAMAGFETGVQFLLFENYMAAARCFATVTEMFPRCWEAWANLGYARLMQYCDDFDTDMIIEFELGPLVVGAFYERPESWTAPSRALGIDADLWWDAVGALREALRQNPESVLAASNLGIAYLVNPEGKDVGQAAKYLDLAAKLAEADPDQPLLARAAVLANAGVADLLDGQNDEGLVRLDAAEEIQRTFAASAPRSGASPATTAAILYHRATLLAASGDIEQQRKALQLYEQYLQTMSRASAWWMLGYEAYAKLCAQLEEAPQPADSFDRAARVALRPVTALELAPGVVVAVGEELRKLPSQLGEGQLLAKVPGTYLKKVRYADYHVTLLVGGRVLAIGLTDADGPPLVLRPSGAATRPVELRVGMFKGELDELLGSEQYDYRQLTDPEINYRFYRNLGIAVRVKQGVVAELIVVQIPERTTTS